MVVDAVIHLWVTLFIGEEVVLRVSDGLSYVSIMGPLPPLDHPISRRI